MVVFKHAGIRGPGPYRKREGDGFPRYITIESVNDAPKSRHHGHKFQRILDLLDRARQPGTRSSRRY